MSFAIKPEQGLDLLHDIALAMVRETRPEGMADFTHRQLAILLTVYLERPPHTVRGLAQKLGVTKPVITRALDAMGKQALGVIAQNHSLRHVASLHNHSLTDMRAQCVLKRMALCLREAHAGMGFGWGLFRVVACHVWAAISQFWPWITCD